MEEIKDEKFVIPNLRHVPLYRYNPENDNSENGWIVHYSKKYLRRQKKLNEQRRATRKAQSA